MGGFLESFLPVRTKQASNSPRPTLVIYGEFNTSLHGLGKSESINSGFFLEGVDVDFGLRISSTQLSASSHPSPAGGAP